MQHYLIRNDDPEMQIVSLSDEDAPLPHLHGPFPTALAAQQEAERLLVVQRIEIRKALRRVRARIRSLEA